ncbi:MAG: beta-N-acetylhexosaminidase, partial [Phocaeicola sp.]|nr:beta-N-acetylhexosaminidase [Phocaeicola sp.]
MKHWFLKMAAMSITMCAALGMEAQSIAVIPQPAQVERQAGTLLLTPDMTLAYDELLEEQATYLKQVVYRSTGFQWKTETRAKRADIVLKIDKQQVPQEEGYHLVVDSKRVLISGHDAGGLFYGIQTFLQLLPPAVYSSALQPDVEWRVPQVSIADAPDHPWRGMMLDVARYFFDKEFVKKYIDM